MILRKPHVCEKSSSSVIPEMFSNHHIGLVFDHQSLWKESIDNLDFWHGDTGEGNIGYETTYFGWLWPVLPCPIKLQDSLIINISGMNLIDVLVFLPGDFIKEM